MTDDELRARLARSNPVPPDAAVDPVEGARATTLRRQIMTNDAGGAGQHGTSRHGPGDATPWWRRTPVAVAAAAAVAAAVVAGIVTTRGADEPDVLIVGPPLELELAASDPLSAMCLPVSEIEPSPDAVALGGEVSAVEGDLVRIAVDRWYAGQPADSPAVVELRGSSQSVALDGVDFVVGERYLVSATEGAVQVCGMSGPASPELEALYDGWYGG